MSHKRIGINNTKGGYLAPNLDFGSSRAVVAGDQVFLVGCTGLTLDGKGFVGKDDPAAQAETAMQNVRILLEEAGAKMEDICLINNYTTDRSYRQHVYPVIAKHLQGVNPASTGLVVNGLAEPYIDFEIDVWVIIPKDRTKGHQRFRMINAKGGFIMPTLDFGNARAIRANNHVFLQGQTGMTLDGRTFIGEGDPAKQAETAMQNVRELLADAGAGIEDVCKITTYLTDPSHQASIYPVLARHFKNVHPVSKNVFLKGLARPEINFEIDVFAIIPEDKKRGHERFGFTHSNNPLDLNASLSKVVRAGNFVFIQGQNGLKLDGKGLTLPGDPAVQADQAMQNVKALLEQAGARMKDICKLTTYVTRREHRASIYSVLGKHLQGVNPVSTGLIVNALENPKLDFEIDVFAVIP